VAGLAAILPWRQLGSIEEWLTLLMKSLQNHDICSSQSRRRWSPKFDSRALPFGIRDGGHYMLHRLIPAFAIAIVLTAGVLAAQTEAPSVIAPADAVPADGVAWVVLSPPSGEKTAETMEAVTLEYTGWNATGTVFDSTAKHPDNRTFIVAGLFPGMRAAVQTMKVGEKRRVWVPAELSSKRGEVVLDVELLEISRPLATPADVAEPPADAEVSKSGVAWKVLTPGSGDTHPKRTSWVTVHYTGWTTDGKMFDSSYLSGAPASLKLDEVIPGWTEGLQTMVPGEKRRFWIPEKRAYAGQKGKPAGMLVFDIELIKFR
jgi:peptidylprolyl isomerase